MTSPAASATKPKHSGQLLFLTIFAIIVALHATLLQLPYFWDEAGHYIPAARDFLHTGDVIPTSTISNAHPPLPMLYLALWWKLLGYSPLVTRLAMLFAASFGIFQVYRLSEKLTNSTVALVTAILTALYPVVFAQSSLAHADLTAFALTMWGLRLYFDHEQPWWKCVTAFALAAVCKETAIVTPMALATWNFPFDLANLRSYHIRFITFTIAGQREPVPHPYLRRESFALLLATIPLVLWYAYHYHRTGHVFGNPEFFRYNVGATLTPIRFLLAAIQRVWQVLGHMNLWVLTALGMAAMLFLPIQKGSQQRPRIALSAQVTFAVVILGHIVLYSLVGGALLTRYMLPCIPLVILLWTSTLWRRIKQWPWLVGFVALTFISGWFVNPPYRFAPEDNLNYADYVRLHQHAADYITQHYPHSRVLTAWTATDELSKPYLGYVTNPITFIQVENFSQEQILLAQQNADYDIALLFSTKYEPPRQLIHWKFWESAHTQYFDYHRDLPPEAISRMLGGKIVMQETQNGQWVAILTFDRVQSVENFRHR